jgi:hypothetical protein
MDANTHAPADIGDLVDSFEAARLLDMPHAFLLRMVKRSLVPCYSLPLGQVRFSRGELLRWLMQHRQEAIAHA